MDPFKNLISQAPIVEERLSYIFKDKTLLALAFVHRSFINEYRNITESHNERLEFLGDAVLGLLVSEYLYRYLPSTPEGELSHLRSRLVEASSCFAYMQKLNLEPFLLLGKGEQRNGGRGRESILADLFEAIIGAIYLDGGIEASQRFLFQNFSEEIEAIIRKPIRNWKAELQDYSQKQYQQPPDYVVLKEEGPDHGKVFTIAVKINEEQVGIGKGSSKKEAQQEAASNALDQIHRRTKELLTDA